MGSRIRRVSFQLHLWVGIVLALYVTVIGVTGSVLVFRAELERLASPWPWKPAGPARARIATVIENVRAAYPRWLLTAIQAPTRNQPGFIAIVQGRTRLRIACDPATGAVLGELGAGPRWLRFIQDLHERLLLTGRQGRIVNGIGGALLLWMILTGLVLWWRRRTILVNFRRRWRRINFDLHSAAAIWTLPFLIVWGVSAIYFAWPAQVFAWIRSISPIVNSTPPRITVEQQQDSLADLDAIVNQAIALDPGTAWKGIRLPSGPRSPLQVVMGRTGGDGSDYEDILFFNQYTGRCLNTWRYGMSETFGDTIVWALAPLHFGTDWGLAVKVVWTLMGLAIPLLAVTGLVMYWNRTLRRNWKRPPSPHAPTRRAIVQSVPAILLDAANPRPYIVGSTATGVPFSFVDLKTSQPSGAMIDIVKAIAADAGFAIELRVTSFSALIPSLTSHKIDVISAGMLRTAAREKVVAFSQPVFSYGGGLVVPASDKKEYRTIADLQGMTVGVQVGTRFYDQLQTSGAREVKTYDNLMDMLMDLSTRRIQAAYGDAPIFAYQMAQARMRAARLVTTFRPPSIEEVCLVVRRDDHDLLARINASIARTKITKIGAILDRWSLR
jgi:uncharacterized iron-regulated membrane protein